jgi:putative ABC transport system permease protein
VPVTFADGSTEDLTVGATYETDNIAGGYLLPRSVWAPHAVQDIDSMVIVDATDGTSVAEAKAAVARAADGFGGPNVEDRDEFAATMTTGVDMMLTIIYALLALAIIIALMGIANTLSLSIYERVRELGLLRAVGADRAQVRSMIRWESVVIAVFGTIFGVALGLFLGWGLVTAAGAGSFPINFAVPTVQIVIVAVVGGIAGVIAAIRPARRAAKLDVIDALATSG